MNQAEIFYPVTVLAGWTFLVLLLIPFQRVKATFKRVLDADDFKLGESDRVPPEVSIPNHNYMNLLEIPVLFYVVCVILFITNHVDTNMVILAWAYVAIRVAHSIIHLTYNNVMHRFPVFVLSNIVLISMWVILLIALSKGTDGI